MIAILRALAASAIVLVSVSGASAADPTAPVRVLFDIATGKQEGELFDETRLSSVFSSSFAETYRIASKVSEMSEAEGMYDYDPLIGGQDGCPLKGVAFRALAPVKETDGDYTPVEVTYDAMSCFSGFENSPPIKRLFRTILEDGRFVVDDYENNTTDEAGKQVSFKEQLIGMTEAEMRRVANRRSAGE